MSLISNRARGIALASTMLAFLWGGAALAETYPAAPSVPAAGGSSNCAGQVTVGGNCHRAAAPSRRVIIAKNELTGGLRSARKGDNGIGYISQTDFVANGYGTSADFDAIEAENRRACTRTGAWIRQSLWIHSQVQSMGPQWDQIGVDLARLGDAQNKVSWGRRGFEAIATGLFCTIPGVGWHYCAGAAANELAGEANGIGSDKAQKLNRRQSRLNAQQSQLNLAATDLWTEENIAWDEMFQGYCLQIFPDETIGYTDKSTPTGPAMTTTWGYWNGKY